MRFFTDSFVHLKRWEVNFLAKLPPSIVDDVLSRSNIVTIVGQYVQLKKSGNHNYSGLCPFHNEKTPSFTVTEDKQFYYCFGCSAGGNVFNFVKEIEGISFDEAVLKVAEMEQIQLPDNLQQVASSQNEFKYQPLIALHEKAEEIYHHILLHTITGAEALSYLLNRGLTEELIKEFKIGFAPSPRNFLSKVFEQDGVSSEQMLQSGLFVSHENEAFRDRFSDRIVFPIRNAQGKTVAFSGRLFLKEKEEAHRQPKYLNSPETEIFNKRDILFNFDKARKVIRKEGTVFLFEGFMDVIAAWQSGIKNGVASMGTSLTSEQILMLERTAQEITFCYDGDEAGIEATNRALELMKEHSRLQMSVAYLPEQLDPDEYVKKYGTKAFYDLAKHGRESVFSFKMRYLRRKFNLANEKEQIEYVQVLLKELMYVDSLIERERYIVQLASEFHIPVEGIKEQLKQLEQRVRQSEKKQPIQQLIEIPFYSEKDKESPIQMVQNYLLGRMFKDLDTYHRFKQSNQNFPNEQYQELFVLFDTYLIEHGEFILAKFLDFLKDDYLKQLAMKIATLRLPEDPGTHELEEILIRLRRLKIEEEIQQKMQEQQEARRLGNEQLEMALAVEIVNLTKQMKS